MPRFFAVQVADDFSCDNGSHDFDKALEIAKAEADNPDNEGMEIRIVYVTDDDDYVNHVEVFREGFCGEAERKQFEAAAEQLAREIEDTIKSYTLLWKEDF